LKVSVQLCAQNHELARVSLNFLVVPSNRELAIVVQKPHDFYRLHVFHPCVPLAAPL
jgi:hypothetical protein